MAFEWPLGLQKSFSKHLKGLLKAFKGLWVVFKVFKTPSKGLLKAFQRPLNGLTKAKAAKEAKEPRKLRKPRSQGAKEAEEAKEPMNLEGSSGN